MHSAELRMPSATVTLTFDYLTFKPKQFISILPRTTNDIKTSITGESIK